MSVGYVQLANGTPLPEDHPEQPFKVILVADRLVGLDRRTEIAAWLADSNCLYLMAWGQDCHGWQDSVNLANLQKYEFGKIPDNALIITTSHEHETLDEVFWYARNTAIHPCATLEQTLILHLSDVSNEEALRKLYSEAV